MAYLTLFDVVEYLIVSSFGGASDAEQRDIRAAVQRAYSEVTTIKDWAYYHTHGRVITEAPVTAGTVTFSKRFNTLTLSGATWPAWAGKGTIRVGPRVADIVARGSDTVVTLDSQVTFMEDFSAQTYILYRTIYPLPADMRNMDEPSNEFFWWSGIYLTPDEAMKVERVNYRSGFPLHWTIIKDPNSTGWAVKLIGYPIKEETIDFTYRRRARPIRFSGHEATSRRTVVTDGGSVMTVSGDELSEAVAGSILRFGDLTNYPGPIESLTPWSEEARIIGKDDDTIMSLDRTGGGADAGTKLIITDPIDVAPHMHNVILSASDYWLARIRNNKPDQAFQLYQRDLRLAMEGDTLAPTSGRSKDIWSDRGWRSPLQPDKG
jgi:hypothetical protein